MLLTPVQQQALAQKAHWYFDCYFGAALSESVVFTGDGLDDLDRLISRITANATDNPARGQRFLCDVGGTFSDWRPFDLEDLNAIRQLYVYYHGVTDKPDAYQSETGSAVALGGNT